MNESLEKFGRIIIENLRDKQIDFSKGLLSGKWKAEELKNLQDKLSKLNIEDKQIAQELVVTVLTGAIHDLLFAIQENNDLEKGIKILVNEKNIADLSGGLHGEIFGDDGWIQKFSKNKSDNKG